MNERTALARLNDAAAIKPFNTPQKEEVTLTVNAKLRSYRG
jgi:hypothetical protein